MIEVNWEQAQRIRELVDSGMDPDEAYRKVTRARVPKAKATPVVAEKPTRRSRGKPLTIRIAGWTPASQKQGGGVNSHLHWSKKSPVNQNDHRTGKEIASRYAGWQCPEIPVLVAVIHWENKTRKKDSDNALNAVKHLIDGVCAGLEIDDRRFLTSMAFQKVDPEGHGFTEIIIRPATLDERRIASS